MIARSLASGLAAGAFACSLFLLSACASTSGEELFEANCSTCHSFKGKGGNTAPDLTAVTELYSGDWIRQQVRDPKKNDPRSRMPAYPRLAAGDIRAIVAYLGN